MHSRANDNDVLAGRHEDIETKVCEDEGEVAREGNLSLKPDGADAVWEYPKREWG